MALPVTEPEYPFLKGGGELGHLTRTHNWAGMPLGPPNTWPQSLQTTLGILLHSAFPMFLFWGDELLCFYNDAYRPSLGVTGKHPALGKPANEVWPEIWDFIGPLIGQVMATGEPVFFEDQLVPIHRNGRLEDVYWTFSYSPIYDDDRHVTGILVTCLETAAKVQAISQLRQSEKTQQEIDERFRLIVELSPVALAVLDGPQFVIAMANDSVLEFWGRQRGEVMNKPLFEALPEAAGQGFEQLLMGVYTTGQPVEIKEATVMLERKGQLERVFFDSVYKAIQKSDGSITGVMVVAVDITNEVLARRKVEESEQYFRRMTNTIPVIIWETRPDGYCTYLNRQWHDLTGQTPAEAEGFGWLDATHPNDKAEAGRLFKEANQKQTDLNAVYRLRQKNSSYRWVINKASPRFAANGTYEGLIGTVVDIHDQKMAEEEATRFKYMADHASDAFILMRKDGSFAYLNQLALDRWGYTAEEARHIRVPDVDPIYNEEVFSTVFARAQQEKIPPFETLHRRKDGQIYPVEVNMGGMLLNGEPHLFAVARNLSDRKQAEETLRQSETKLRSVIEIAPVSIGLFVGRDLVVELANQSFIEDAGKGPDIVGKPLREAMPELVTENQPFLQILDDCYTSGNPFQSFGTPVDIRLKDVVTRNFYNITYNPLFDETGAVYAILNIAVDVTEQVLTQQQVAESEARFQNLIRSARVGIVVLIGEEIRVEIVNDSYAQLIDRSCEDLLGKPLFSIVPEAELPFRALLDNVRNTGETLYLNEVPYFIWANGIRKEGFVSTIYQPYREHDGLITGVIALCQDVTEQVLARQKVEESEARFRNLVAQATVATAVFSGRNMVVELANDAVLEIWGRDRSIIGKPLLEFLPEIADQPFPVLLDGVFMTGETFITQDAPAQLVRGGKLETLYLDFSYQALRDSQETITGILVMATDVTEKVKARQKIEEAEATLRGAIELAELGTWEIDVATNCVVYSDRIQAWFGYEAPTKMIDGMLYDPVHERDRSRVEAAVFAALQPGSSGIYDQEYTVVDQQTGAERIIHAQGKTYFDPQGMPVKLSGTAQEVTQQRNLQHELERQVQERTRQLQSSVNDLQRSNQNLQQFAYVASHDLQEPLRKIRSFGDLLQNQYGDQLGEGTDYLTRIQTAAARMSTLIKDLLSFSRISTQQEATDSVSLTDVVQTALNTLEIAVNETGAQINVEPLPTVLGDASQLGQLFQNLLSNALKFRRANVPAQIQVRYQRIADSELPLLVNPARSAPFYHRVDVIDNGIGFDEKYISRIFQVFQRLHGRGEFAGTGIGLAICEKVAANHGGAITATSQTGQGATFSVYLPV